MVFALSRQVAENPNAWDYVATFLNNEHLQTSAKINPADSLKSNLEKCRYSRASSTRFDSKNCHHFRNCFSPEIPPQLSSVFHREQCRHGHFQVFDGGRRTKSPPAHRRVGKYHFGGRQGPRPLPGRLRPPLWISPHRDGPEPANTTLSRGRRLLRIHGVVPEKCRRAD